MREALGGRGLKKKGGEAKEEEVDPLEVFFYHIYEFLYTILAVAQVDVPVNVIVPPPSPVIVTSPVIVSSPVAVSSPVIVYTPHKSYVL